MVSLSGLVALSSYCIVLITAFQYEIELRDEKIFVPCEDHTENSLDKFLDMTKLNFQTLDNGSIYINGDVEIIQNLTPEAVIQTSIQLYKKNRDSWINTIYNFNRLQTCYAVFDPTEIWHGYVKNFPIEQQKCPFYTGQKFSFDVMSDLKIELQDPRLAGEYKATFIITVQDSESNAVSCSNAFATVYRT